MVVDEVNNGGLRFSIIHSECISSRPQYCKSTIDYAESMEGRAMQRRHSHVAAAGRGEEQQAG